jgi:hypothetical protein
MRGEERRQRPRLMVLNVDRVQMHAYLVGAAYNLLRIARLLPAPA